MKRTKIKKNANSKTGWKEILNKDDYLNIKVKNIDCNDKENHKICEWRLATQKRIASLVQNTKPNKKILKRILNYSNDEIDLLKQSIKLKKKYKDIYHENTWITDTLILESFKVIKKKIEKELKK